MRKDKQRIEVGQNLGVASRACDLEAVSEMALCGISQIGNWGERGNASGPGFPHLHRLWAAGIPTGFGEMHVHDKK